MSASNPVGRVETPMHGIVCDRQWPCMARRSNAGGRCAWRHDETKVSSDTFPPSSRHDHKTRSEEHTSELQSLMRISYAVFCLKKKNKKQKQRRYTDKKIK